MKPTSHRPSYIAMPWDKSATASCKTSHNSLKQLGQFRGSIGGGGEDSGAVDSLKQGLSAGFHYFLIKGIFNFGLKMRGWDKRLALSLSSYSPVKCFVHADKCHCTVRYPAVWYYFLSLNHSKGQDDFLGIKSLLSGYPRLLHRFIVYCFVCQKLNKSNKI